MKFTSTKSRVASIAGAIAITAGSMAAIGVTAVSASASASHRHLATGTTSAPTGNVLTVGTFKGHAGQYSTIQAAVDHAHSGDWILVAPGDYKENADLGPAQWNAAPAQHDGYGGVLITTPNLHIRGLNRNTVIVDGTKPGAPACSSNANDQQFGYTPGAPTAAYGRNGITVYEANNVSIDNLSVCNFLSGTHGGGNQIWWNGGADTATINLHGYEGSFLSATTNFFNGNSTAGTYGIFSSDAAGPASWSHIYASNMNDSGMYVGACKRVCGITIDNALMESNALGYSGTNSGGAIVIKNSLFQNNQDGFDTNTQIAGDPPAPQDGACPGNGISPITHTHSCWVLMNNTFKNNNNAHAPASGNAAAGPTGTGLTISGGRNDTVMNNTFIGNNAWGMLMVPFPDGSTPEKGQSCTGTGGVEVSGFGCMYDPMNDALLNNTFSNNGSYGNVSNGDYGQLAFNANEPSNCFVGNTHPDGQGTRQLQRLYPTCGINRVAPDLGYQNTLLGQVLCDTGFGGCPKGVNYPNVDPATGNALPRTVILQSPGFPTGANKQPVMGNPCAGVPDSLWCKSGALITS